MKAINVEIRGTTVYVYFAGNVNGVDQGQYLIGYNGKSAKMAEENAAILSDMFKVPNMGKID